MKWKREHAKSIIFVFISNMPMAAVTYFLSIITGLCFMFRVITAFLLLAALFSLGILNQRKRRDSNLIKKGAIGILKK